MVVGVASSAPIWCVLVVFVALPHQGGARVPTQLSEGLDEFRLDGLESPLSAVVLNPIHFATILLVVGTLRILAILAAREAGDAHVRLSRGVVGRVRVSRTLLLWLVGAKVAGLAVWYRGLLPGESPRGQLHGWGPWAVALAFVGFSVWALRDGSDANRERTGRARVLVGAFCVALAVPSLVLLGAGLVDLLRFAVNPWSRRAWPATNWALDQVLSVSDISFLPAVLLVGLTGVLAMRSSGRTATAVFGVGAALWGLPAALQIAAGRMGSSPGGANSLAAGDLALSLPVLDVVVTATIAVCALALRGSPSPRTLGVLATALLSSSLLVVGFSELLPQAWREVALMAVLVLSVLWRFLVDTEDDHARPASRLVLAMTAWGLLLTVSAVGLASGFGQAEWEDSRRLQWQLIVVPLILVWLFAVPPSDHGARGPGWRGSPRARTSATPDGSRSFAIGVVVALVLVGSATTRALVSAQDEHPRASAPGLCDVQTVSWVSPTSSTMTCGLMSSGRAASCAGGDASHAPLATQERTSLIADLNAAVRDSWAMSIGCASKNLMSVMPTNPKMVRRYGSRKSRAASWSLRVVGTPRRHAHHLLALHEPVRLAVLVVREEVAGLHDGIDVVLERVRDAEVPHRHRHQVDVRVEEPLDGSLDLAPRAPRGVVEGLPGHQGVLGLDVDAGHRG